MAWIMADLLRKKRDKKAREVSKKVSRAFYLKVVPCTLFILIQQREVSVTITIVPIIFFITF